MVFIRLVERRVLSPLKWPRGDLRASVSKRGYASDRHSQFWGDIKLCLCEACYYLPTPPLGQDMTQGQFLSGV